MFCNVVMTSIKREEHMVILSGKIVTGSLVIVTKSVTSDSGPLLFVNILPKNPFLLCAFFQILFCWIEKTIIFGKICRIVKKRCQMFREAFRPYLGHALLGKKTFFPPWRLKILRKISLKLGLGRPLLSLGDPPP